MSSPKTTAPNWAQIADGPAPATTANIEKVPENKVDCAIPQPAHTTASATSCEKLGHDSEAGYTVNKKMSQKARKAALGAQKMST